MKDENKAKNAYSLTVHGLSYSAAIERLATARKSLVYGIVALEHCKDGKPHIQAYLFFKQPRRFHYVLKIFPGCHIEPARKSPEANACYCRKEGVYIERGNLELAQKLWFGEAIQDIIDSSKEFPPL